MSPRPLLLIPFALCLSLAGLSTGATEDLTLVVKITGLRGGVTASEYISGSRVRMSQGGFDTIYDTATGRIVQIDTKAKEYYETWATEIQARNEAMQRESKRPSPSPAGPSSAQKGTTPAVATGQPCDPYTLESGTLKLEVCLARAYEAPAHAEAQRLAALRTGGGDPALQAIYAQLKTLGRLPLTELRTGKVGDLVTRSQREVLEVKAGPLPPGTFEAPAGYKRKESPYKAAAKPAVPPKP